MRRNNKIGDIAGNGEQNEVNNCPCDELLGCSHVALRSPQIALVTNGLAVHVLFGGSAK